MTPPRFWSEIAWPEIRAGDAARWIAVLPLAAIEQHGPHLPLGADVLIAEAYLARVQRLLPDAIPAVVLPIQPVGISTEHRAFPGTLSLPPQIAIEAWRAIGESVARAGLRKLVIVTSHGGNSAAMSLVAQELRAAHRLAVVTTAWSRFGAPDGLFGADELRHGIHGGAVETAILLAHRPDLVRRDRLARFPSNGEALAGENRWLSLQRPAAMAWQAEDLNSHGVAGDATAASAENGERLLDHGARAFVELLKEFDRFDPDAFFGSPPE